MQPAAVPAFAHAGNLWTWVAHAGLLLALLAGAGNIAAKPDTARAANAETTAATPIKARCSGLRWNPDLLRASPRLASSCREVLRAGGRRWARLETNFIGASQGVDGFFITRVLDANDRPLGQLTLRPAPDQRVTLDGRHYRFSELRLYQKLILFIPEGEPDIFSQLHAPRDQAARLIAAEPNRETLPSASSLDPVPTDSRAVLPVISRSGASIGMLMLGGGSLLALLGGALLALRRRSA